MLALDASNIVRPFSETARDRTTLHLHNLPESGAGATITNGWQFSTVVLPPQPSSGVYVLDNARIPSQLTPDEVAAEQLNELILTPANAELSLKP